MANWFYYDSNGNKIGPVDSSILKQLALSGAISLGTVVETDAGKTGVAGSVQGLVFSAPTQSETTLYSHNGNLITNKKIVLNGITLTVGQIVTIRRDEVVSENLVEAPMDAEEKKKRDAAVAKGCLPGCFGFVILGSGITMVSNHEFFASSYGLWGVAAIVIGVVLLVVGIGIVGSQSPPITPPIKVTTTKYFFSIATSNTALPLHSYETTDKTDADAFEKALNDAIASH